MTADSNVVAFEVTTGISGLAKAEVGMFAAVHTENGWVPCLVAAVTEWGLAIKFCRGRRSFLPGDLWSVDSKRRVTDAKGMLKKLKPRYRDRGEMIADITRQL